jgi:uncharacterized protein YjbJ (UPF0337 family)
VSAFNDLLIAHATKSVANKYTTEDTMNWDQIQGQWKDLKGQVRVMWGKLTDDDLEKIAGKKDQLVGKIQEKYGLDKAKAEKAIDDFAKNLKTKH